MTTFSPFGVRILVFVSLTSKFKLNGYLNGRYFTVSIFSVSIEVKKKRILTLHKIKPFDNFAPTLQ